MGSEYFFLMVEETMIRTIDFYKTMICNVLYKIIYFNLKNKYHFYPSTVLIKTSEI
jgi:hypothetical protein